MAGHYLDERTYETGDTIFEEGDDSNEMFIIQDGRVGVTKKVAGREVFLTSLERGDFFGEMSMLNSQPRSATCRALAPTRLVAIRSGELLIKLRRDPTFALEMLQQMSRRVRHLDEEVAKLMEENLGAHRELERLRAETEFRVGPDRS